MKDKAILLISYYFPPCGGAPVQRWHRFLPHLMEAGIKPVILTTDGGDYPYLDATLLDELPPELEIVRTHAPAVSRIWKLIFGQKAELPHGSLDTSNQESGMKRLLIWLRLNLIIPDLRVFWLPSALKKAKRLIREYGIKTVVTTGPPHSTHLIGLRLKKTLKIRWLADWRDPWSEVYYLQQNPPSWLSRQIHKFLERRVCQTADTNIVISRLLLDTLPKGNKILIRNGYDATAIAKAKAEAVLDTRFTISYVGQITAGQDLRLLCQILMPFRRYQDFRMRFIGARLSIEQQQLFSEQLSPIFEILPFLPHQEALREMSRSQILVLLINRYPGAQGMLTTKLYEYLGTGIPILCIGPKGGEAEELISHYHAGLCVDHHELLIAQNWIAELYRDFCDGKAIVNERDTSELCSFAQVKSLIDIWERWL